MVVDKVHPIVAKQEWLGCDLHFHVDLPKSWWLLSMCTGLESTLSTVPVHCSMRSSSEEEEEEEAEEQVDEEDEVSVEQEVEVEPEEEVDEEEEEEEEDQERHSDSEGSQSSISYDEGSYDGREGKIVYTCKDDESIQQGAPGAKMFDQNIRETWVLIATKWRFCVQTWIRFDWDLVLLFRFELGEEMMSACEMYALWLEDSTQVNTKQLVRELAFLRTVPLPQVCLLSSVLHLALQNSSINVIQQEWFKVSSSKTSNPSMVEDYLTCFNEVSQDLLEHVVNMADGNVRIFK